MIFMVSADHIRQKAYILLKDVNQELFKQIIGDKFETKR